MASLCVRTGQIALITQPQGGEASQARFLTNTVPAE